MTNKDTFQSFLLELNTFKWSDLSPSFLVALKDLLLEAIRDPQIDSLPVRKPSYVDEAQAMTEFTFFNGAIQRVFDGEKFTDDLMKELMIESSRNVKDWLLMRELLQSDDRYASLVCYVIAQGGEKKLPKLSDSWSDKVVPQEYMDSLNKIILPYIKKTLKNASPNFQVAIASQLHKGSVPSDELNSRLKPSLPREANGMTAFTFRNTELENIHAGHTHPTTQIQSQLRENTTLIMANWLYMRDVMKPDLYDLVVRVYWYAYCEKWNE